MSWLRPVALAGLVILTTIVMLHVLCPPLGTALFHPPPGVRTPADLGLAYEDVVLRGAGRIRLPVWRVSGHGPAVHGGGVLVLLLAENGSDRHSLRLLWLAARLAEHGTDSLLVDLRGHGDSSGVNTYGLGETLDLLRILQTLKDEGPDRPLVAAGFSLGAACILRAMSVSRALEAAAVFAPYARLDAALIRSELDYQTSGRPVGRALAWLLSARLVRLSLELWAGFPSLPAPEELVTDRPVHVFHCIGDPEIPYQNALDIVAGARAPALVLHPVARGTHLPPMEDTRVWEEFAAALDEIVDGLIVDR